MADDISKKITIEVELEAEKVTENINELNKAIDTLLTKQKDLNTSGQQNAAIFEAVTSKLEEFQKKLKEVNTQVTANTTALNALGTSGKAAEASLKLLADSHHKSATAAGDSSVKVKELTGQVNALNQAAKQQKGKTDEAKSALEGYAGSVAKGTATGQQLQGSIVAATSALGEQAGAVSANKTTFDAHKATMDALSSSFDKLKGVSGTFGPSLEEAAKGFESLKSGLEIVKTGFNNVGDAIKTTGFGQLVLVLQSVVDYFTKTTQGSAILKGAISAVGKVVEDIHQAFAALGKIIVDAVSHPVDSIKHLAEVIKENIINHFKAFSVILDGIIHLDFKKMADGAIQAFTGVTHATDKIVSGYHAVVNGAKNISNEMVTEYKKGYKEAGKQVAKHEKKVHESNNRIKKSHESVINSITETSNNTQVNQCECDEKNSVGQDALVAKAAGVTSNTPDDLPKEPQGGFKTTLVQKTADKTVEIKKTALQKVEDFAKQSGVKIATDALNTLNNSIKQQEAAKIASLEKSKAAELSNSSLTSAQKLAIQQKYKKQEDQVKVKAFKQEQDISIAQALINGALAITKVEAQTGILGELAIPVIIAETAIQVAAIASKKPPAYASGGLHYASDGRGGVLPGYSSTDNTNAYLRSGEGIVVSEAMQVPWARNLVSAINVGFGGKDFSMTNPGRGYAVGGIFTDGGDANRYYNQPVHDQKNLANTIAYQMINNFPPVYVDVKDVNNQQNILAQTINRVNL